MKTKVLRKCQIHPLKSFALKEEAEEHDAITTDEQLAAFYHKMLNKFEDRPLVCNFIYAMMSYSVEYCVRNLKTEL